MCGGYESPQKRGVHNSTGLKGKILAWRWDGEVRGGRRKTMGWASQAAFYLSLQVLKVCNKHRSWRSKTSARKHSWFGRHCHRGRNFAPGIITIHNLDFNIGGAFSVTGNKKTKNQASQHQLLQLGQAAQGAFLTLSQMVWVAWYAFPKSFKFENQIEVFLLNLPKPLGIYQYGTNTSHNSILPMFIFQFNEIHATLPKFSAAVWKALSHSLCDGELSEQRPLLTRKFLTESVLYCPLH